MIVRFFLSSLFLISISGIALSQPSDDVERGRMLAEQQCSECHAVDQVDQLAPERQGASFYEIANTPGMTPLALSVWFKTPHREMPNFILPQQTQDDLIAFIESLRAAK